MQPIQGAAPLTTANQQEQQHKQTNRANKIKPETTIMQIATQQLRLPNIQGKTINTPKLIARLGQQILDESNQKATTELVSFKQLTQADINTPEKASDAFQDTFLELGQNLCKRDNASQELISKAKNKLNNQSAIIQYASAVEAEYKDSKPLILEMINTARHIGAQLITAPEAIVLSTLRHFPPPAEDLECFDGTQTRLENSKKQLKQELVQAGLIKPTELMQTLDNSIPEQLPINNNTLVETNYETGIAQHIHKDFNVHQAKAMLLKLGIDPNLFKENDRYAFVTLKHIAGNAIYDTLNKYEKNLFQRLLENTQTEISQSSLDLFQDILKDLTNPEKLEKDAQELAQNVDDKKLIAGYLEDPFGFKMQELKKMPLTQAITEQLDNKTFEQVFGKWDETITELEGWKWQELNKTLSDILHHDWALIDNKDLALKDISYDEIDGMNVDYIGKLIAGQGHEYDQHHALMFIMNKLAHADIRHSNKSLYNRETALQILIGSQGPLKRLEHEKLTTYVKARLDASISRTTASTNKELLQQLKTRIDEVFGQHYPYDSASLRDIRTAFENFKNNVPMDILDASYLIDREIPLDKITSYASKHLIADEKSYKSLVFILNNLINSHNKYIPAFIDALTAHKPEIKKQAIEELIIKQLIQNEYRPNLVKTMIESKSSLAYWFPEVLASEALHTTFPPLTTHLLAYAIEHNRYDILQKMQKSTQAIDNLISRHANASSSIVAYAEQQKLYERNPDFAKAINRIPWPIEHYLDTNNRIDDSSVFAQLTNTLNIDRFKTIYKAMNNINENAGKQIIKQFVAPVFRAASEPEHLKFFVEICENLNTTDQEFLAKQRGAMLEHTLADQTNWRHHLMQAMLFALPDEATTPMAALLHLHIHEQRQNMDHIVNKAIAITGVNPGLLANNYPIQLKAADHFAQIIHAISEPRYTIQQGHLMNSATGIGKYISKTIDQNKMLFLEALSYDRFPAQCTRLNQNQEKHFLAVFSRLPRQLQQALKTELLGLPSHQRLKIPETLRSIIEGVI
ncbi:MAG: hypothetical protein CMD81_01385 [Gammaproteobacteria bacterium]|nr:hypothetical protein [Gammaproteobacteria bacterium]HBF09946.1 hypothetical protein [Gammaproteobacteria bacterium]|tara:strand:+ start:94555 stop:97650 length:3096 start_codon:yes stop_codon:yes gene_type:complete